MAQDANAVKQITIKYEDRVGTLVIGNGGQSKETIETWIRSLLELDASSSPIIGLAQLTSSATGDEGPLIPLNVLEATNSVLHPSITYTPKFAVPNTPTTLPLPYSLPVPDYSEQQYNYSANNTDANYTQTPYDTQAANTNSAQAPATTNYYTENDPWQNWEYFHQYGKIDIHHEMLKDEARTSSYREAIMSHADQFKDKVVLDIGCGTGILSFFCAAAGAKKVYAVEASSLADWTELLVASNGKQDIIQVIRGRVEEIMLPERVDIIVSEWMGTFLIFESMLESVLNARDRLLKADGVMWPSHATILLSPVCMDELYNDKINFWKKVYDVDMSAIIPFAKRCAFEKPIIDKAVKTECVLAPPVVIKSFDLKTVPQQEPYNKTIVKFSFQSNRTGNMHGFVAWFDVLFKWDENDSHPVTLSTAPECKDTHWHQDLFLFDDPISVEQGNTISGTLRYQRNPDLLRHLIIDINFTVVESGKTHAKKFFLWGPDQAT